MPTESTEALLRQMLIWIRASSFANVETLLKKTLTEDRMRAAYQATDGTATVAQVKTLAKVGGTTIQQWYDRWVAVGIMEEFEPGKRRRLFDLANFGMLPKIAEEAEAGESRD